MERLASILNNQTQKAVSLKYNLKTPEGEGICHEY